MGGDLGAAAKGILLGVLRGTKEAGVANLETIAQTAESVIKTTGRMSGDLASTAKGLVEGAIQGAKEVGLDVTQAASAAATGALRAAGEFGSEAGRSVRDALTGTIAGVKVVLKEPFHSSTRSGRDGVDRRRRDAERDATS